MTIYTHCGGDHADKGKRIEAQVIYGDGHYALTAFRLPGQALGWELMTRRYKTLVSLLQAVRAAGILC